MLSDRINYYFNNEQTQCQPNCQFSEYSFEKQNLKCKCEIESDKINFEKDNFSYKNTYKSFYDVLKYSNYKVLKCYNLAFSFNIFKNNRGNIIMIIFIAIFLILLFIYFLKGITSFKMDISRNIFNIFQRSINEKKIDNNNNVKVYKNNKRLNKVKNIESKKNIIIKKYNNKSSTFQNNKHNNFNSKNFFFPPKKNKNPKNKVKFTNEELLNNNKSNSKYLFGTNIIKKNKDLSSNISKQNLDNFELNNLDYNDAINLDKRNFFEIYWSFLKREHLIIFTFFVLNVHNITFVKYTRFIFIFCTDMALNVFFFSDETMHKMFLDYGKYNFIQQIPQIIYSSIVSQILEIFLCYLSLTDIHYYKIKNLDINSRYMALQIIKCIKIKFCFFYILSGLFLLFYWYIITCFCSVYENTQKAFIKDSLLSFSAGLLYPFLIYILPTSLRILSFKCKKGKLSFVYKLSDFIPCF